MKKILLHCAMEKEGRQIANKLRLKKVKENLYSLEETSINTIIQKEKNAKTKEETSKESKNNPSQTNTKDVDLENATDVNLDLLITGIGKQRTAIELTRYLENNEKPDMVINIGYAGSTNTKIGTWVSISKVYNYEWNIPGEERYSMTDLGNQELITINSLEKMPCYSAEEFVTNTKIKESVIFDMELHSLAIICDEKKIKLASIKKVSDNLNIKDYYNSIKTENIMELESGLKYIEEIYNNI